MENGEEGEAGGSAITFPDGVERNCCDGGLEEHRGVSSTVRWQQQITSERHGTGGDDAELRLKDDKARHILQLQTVSKLSDRNLKNLRSSVKQLVQPAEIHHLNSKQIPEV